MKLLDALEWCAACVAGWMYLLMSLVFQGFLPSLSTESESAFNLATRWQHHLLLHRQHGAHGGGMDELGLRIVEGDDLPPSLVQIFQT